MWNLSKGSQRKTKTLGINFGLVELFVASQQCCCNASNYVSWGPGLCLAVRICVYRFEIARYVLFDYPRYPFKIVLCLVFKSLKLITCNFFLSFCIKEMDEKLFVVIYAFLIRQVILWSEHLIYLTQYLLPRRLNLRGTFFDLVFSWPITKLISLQWRIFFSKRSFYK